MTTSATSKAVKFERPSWTNFPALWSLSTAASVSAKGTERSCTRSQHLLGMERRGNGSRKLGHSYCRMQIEDVHTVSPKLPQTRVELLSQDVRFVNSWRVWVDFCGDCESPLLPFSFTSERLLLPSNVCSSSINLVVASSLEVIQKGVVLGERGDSSSCLGIRTKSHKTQDHSRL
jgi:hypothetical protein